MKFLNKKSFIFKLLPLSFILLVGFAFSQDEIELKFASLAPQSSTWGQTLSEVRRQVFIQTNKKVKIKIYWGGQMGDEAEMIGKIKVGQLDGCALTGNGLGLILKESRVLELPQLFANHAQVDSGYEKAESLLEKYFNEKGFELVSLSETGNAYFFSKKPINNFKDVSNTKMWLWKGDEFAKIVFDSLEIGTVPVSFTDVIPSLQTGLIDGFYSTPSAAISLQWSNQAKYFLKYPLTDVTGGILFGSDTWSKLSDEQKNIVTQVVRKAVKQLTNSNRLNDEKSIELLKKYGLTINTYKGKQPEVRALHQKILSQLKNLSGVNADHVDELFKILTK